jgi:hypothetical protein
MISTQNQLGMIAGLPAAQGNVSGQALPPSEHSNRHVGNFHIAPVSTSTAPLANVATAPIPLPSASPGVSSQVGQAQEFSENILCGQQAVSLGNMGGWGRWDKGSVRCLWGLLHLKKSS